MSLAAATEWVSVEGKAAAAGQVSDQLHDGRPNTYEYREQLSPPFTCIAIQKKFGKAVFLSGFLKKSRWKQVFPVRFTAFWKITVYSKFILIQIYTSFHYQLIFLSTISNTENNVYVLPISQTIQLRYSTIMLSKTNVIQHIFNPIYSMHLLNNVCSLLYQNSNVHLYILWLRYCTTLWNSSQDSNLHLYILWWLWYCTTLWNSQDTHKASDLDNDSFQRKLFSSLSLLMQKGGSKRNFLKNVYLP